MKIDAHHHCWQYDPARYAWITDDLAPLRRDFTPADLQPLLAAHGLGGCVLVESEQTEAATAHLLHAAAQHAFIKGAVGWVDLQAPDVAERLAYYQQFNKLKGLRHGLQSEADRAFMRRPAFRRGIAALGASGFTYDLLILPDQLGYASELVAAFPNQRFVLDHLAKPPIKTQEISDWRRDIRRLAAHDNVWCKVSGLVTEAAWHQWQPADFRPYLDVTFEAFGPARTMFGSDWPVCEVAGGYAAVVGLAQQYMAALSASEQALFWGETATAFYQLTD
jgi:L-fuconolactonase